MKRSRVAHRTDERRGASRVREAGLSEVVIVRRSERGHSEFGLIVNKGGMRWVGGEKGRKKKRKRKEKKGGGRYREKEEKVQAETKKNCGLNAFGHRYFWPHVEISLLFFFFFFN